MLLWNASILIFRTPPHATAPPPPKTQKGNECVLMMVDQFTKWVECILLPCQTADERARATIDHFFSWFGYPFQVFSDRGGGGKFESMLLTELCKASVKGQCEKLCPSWKGPGIIERKFPSNVFRVKLRDAIMVLNHEQIKPCRGRAFPAWIRQ